MHWHGNPKSIMRADPRFPLAQSCDAAGRGGRAGGRRHARTCPRPTSWQFGLGDVDRSYQPGHDVAKTVHDNEKSDAGHGIAFRGSEANSKDYGLLSASFLEISAVWVGVPQLGASLPSPHLRGR